MQKLLPLILLISCGRIENENVAQSNNLSRKEGTLSNSGVESLGFNQQSSILTRSDAGKDGIDQYVRFKHGNNNCSGVLSWEWESPNDVYLYTARHCFEKSNPITGVQWDFDVKSNTKQLIDAASGFDSNMNIKSVQLRSDNIEALNLEEKAFGRTRPTDVVRLYQYSSKSHNLIKICNSGNIVRAGYRGSFGYPDPRLRSPNGVVKSVAEVEYEVLLSKLSKWLPKSRLDLSSHLVKLANSTTMPGESGSPVFVATENKIVFNNLDPKMFSFNCIDGIMSREITRIGMPSETYYNVMSFGTTSRTWSKVWAKGGVFPKTEQKVSQVPATTTNRLDRMPASNEVALSLQDVTSGEDIITEIVSIKSRYQDDCDKLVLKTYAKNSSNEFKCFANGKLVFFYDAPGYLNKFNPQSGAQYQVSTIGEYSPDGKLTGVSYFQTSSTVQPTATVTPVAASTAQTSAPEYFKLSFQNEHGKETLIENLLQSGAGKIDDSFYRAACESAYSRNVEKFFGDTYLSCYVDGKLFWSRSFD